jgi:hypothetical protein
VLPAHGVGLQQLSTHVRDPLRGAEEEEGVSLLAPPEIRNIYCNIAILQQYCNTPEQTCYPAFACVPPFFFLAFHPRAQTGVVTAARTQSGVL